MIDSKGMKPAEEEKIVKKYDVEIKTGDTSWVKVGTGDRSTVPEWAETNNRNHKQA